MEALDGDTAMDCSVASDTLSIVEAVCVLRVPNDAVIVAVAGADVVAALKTFGKTPKLLATVSSEETHVAILVTSRVLPSLNVPMAERVDGVLFAIVGFAGRIATETRLDRSTLRVGGIVNVDVDCPPNDALTSNEVPTLLPIAKPLYALIKGPDGAIVQFARLVTSCVDVSLNVAMALYCCWFSNPMVALAGVMAREDTVAPVTVSCALFETFPKDALITTVPADIPVARP